MGAPGDGAPCPATHGSAPFLNKKKPFLPPAEDGCGLKIQTNFVELGKKKTLPVTGIKHCRVEITKPATPGWNRGVSAALNPSLNTV